MPFASLRSSAPGTQGVCGRRRPRAREGLSPGSGVDIELVRACVCARSRVSTRVSACVSLGEGALLEANHGLRGAQPSAPPSRRLQELRALKPFMILVTLFQEWARGGRGLPGPSPAPAPINTASRALCGAASSVENRELRVRCRRPGSGVVSGRRTGERLVPAPRRLPRLSAPLTSLLGTR